MSYIKVNNWKNQHLNQKLNSKNQQLNSLIVQAYLSSSQNLNDFYR